MCSALLLEFQVRLPRLLQLRLGIRMPLLELGHRRLAERLARRLALLGVLQLDGAALGARHASAHQHHAQLIVHLEHFQVLHRDVLVAHAARHLLARQDAAAAALRGARRANGAVVLGVAVRRLLAREAVALHAAREAHAARPRPGVDVLPDAEPVGLQLHAHGQQPFGAADLELVQLRLGRDALGLVVAQELAGNGARVLGAVAHLHRPVAVGLARAVGDDLHLVELQHRARRAHLADEHARHALLGRQHARPVRGRVLASLQGGGRAGGEDGEARVGLVESSGLGAWVGR